MDRSWFALGLLKVRSRFAPRSLAVRTKYCRSSLQVRRRYSTATLTFHVPCGTERPVFHAVTRWVRGYNRGSPAFQYLLPKLDLFTYKTFPLLVHLCSCFCHTFSKEDSLLTQQKLQTCYVISDALPTSSGYCSNCCSVRLHLQPTILTGFS